MPRTKLQDFPLKENTVTEPKTSCSKSVVCET